jgi:ferritin-like metal-binding protein YciE
LEPPDTSARCFDDNLCEGAKTVELTNIRDLYLAELQELASGTELLAEPLAKVAEVTSDPTLKQALTDHSEQTLLQRQRIDVILRTRGIGPIAHTDQAMQALLKELGKMSAMLRSDGLRDAGLIGSLQRIGHYRMAAYACAAALAARLDLPDDEKLLDDGLDAEKRFDGSLRKISESQLAEQEA